jgi:hypothetical protein
MSRTVEWLSVALLVSLGLVALVSIQVIERDSGLMFSEHPAMMYRIHGLADSGTWYVFRSGLWNGGTDDSSAAASGVAHLSWLWRAVPGERPVHEGYALFLGLCLGLASPILVALIARAAGASWFASSLTGLLSSVSSYQQVRSLLFEGTVGMNSAMVAAAVAGIACHHPSAGLGSGRRWCALLTFALAWCSQWPIAMPFVASVLAANWLQSHGSQRSRHIAYVAVFVVLTLPLLAVLLTAVDSPLKAINRSVLFERGASLSVLGISLASGGKWLVTQPAVAFTLLAGLVSFRASGGWPKPAVHALLAILCIGVTTTLLPGTQSDRGLLMLGPFLAHPAILSLSAVLSSSKAKCAAVSVAFAWCALNYAIIVVSIVSRPTSPLVTAARVVAASPATTAPLLITEAAMRATSDTSWAYFPIAAGRRCLAARIYRDLSPLSTSAFLDLNDQPNAILTLEGDPLLMRFGVSGTATKVDKGLVLYELAPHERAIGGTR